MATPNSISFYTTASTLFATIGITTVVQSTIPSGTSRRGRTRWTSVDTALTFAGLSMLGAGEILVQTVIARGQAREGEHFWTVVLLCCTSGVVIVKLGLQRALAVGWTPQHTVDKNALNSFWLSVAVGLGVGGATIGVVISRISRSEIGLILSIIVGAVAIIALFWFVVRLIKQP